MSRYKCLSAMVTSALFGVLQAQTVAVTTYTNASLKGSFSFVETGFPGPAGTVAAVGVLTADGSGGVTGNLTARWPGQGVFNTDVTGQYQINQDGTGQLTIGVAIPSSNSDQLPVARSYSLVFSKRGVSGITSDQGLFSILDLEAQPGAAVTMASLAGRYGYTETGVINGSLPRIAVGDFVLDASGGVTGTMQERVANSGASSYTFTGTYTVANSGVGTITIDHSVPNLSGDDTTVIESKFTFVAGPNAKLSAIRLDSGATAVGDFERQ